MYEDYPFWFTVFTRLGFSVRLSPRSSRAVYEAGLETIPSESVCYPGKLVHGHVARLMKEGVPFIFYPCMPHSPREDPGARNHFNCPIVTSYPEVVLEQRGRRAARRGAVCQSLPSLARSCAAEEAPGGGARLGRRDGAGSGGCRGRRARRAGALQGRGARAGRGGAAGDRAPRASTASSSPAGPTTWTPRSTTASRSSPSPSAWRCSRRTLSRTSGRIQRPLRVVDQWTYHTRLYAAAHAVAERDDLELVQLNSFGCGLDAVTTDQVQEILEARRQDLHA